MSANLYRLYSGEPSDENYEFSIIATDNNARYVVPMDDIETKSIFNYDRIADRVMLADKETLPTTPDDWANFAAYNAGYNSFLQFIETSQLEEMLTNDEQEYADANYSEKVRILEEREQIENGRI
jgi:hypothetical protein